MSQMVQNLALAALKLHPRNEEFFSNAEGEDFKRLKESIAEQGILTPLRVSSDMVIVSGHQRYRAAKELGLTQVPVIVDEALLDEDEKLVQLIASNFGRMKNDPVKQGRWIKEYERLRGVKRGNNQHRSLPNNSVSSQEYIAKELGVTVDTLQNLKRLNTLLPELQDIISEGRISATTGFKLIARLSEEEQRQLLESLPEAQKFTQHQVQTYIDQIKGYETRIDELNFEKAEMQKEAAEATRAARSGQDTKQYLEMQKKLKDAEDKYRQEYEAHQKLVKNTREINERTNRQVRELEAKLAKAEAKANAAPMEVEIEVEKEVYPKDYEELKQKAQAYDQYVRGVVNTKVVKSASSEEELQHEYEMRFNQHVEGLLPELEGLLVDKYRLGKMTKAQKQQYDETLNRIFEICSEMQDAMENKEVA